MAVVGERKEEVYRFLEGGGVVVIYSFSQAPRFYFEEIAKLKDNLPLSQKISLVLARKNDDPALQELSHIFISVGFLTEDSREISGEACEVDLEINQFSDKRELEKWVNGNLDQKFETADGYAGYVIYRSLLEGHMDEVVYALV